jgi:ABC-type phosphate/phosphonate transport system permease subunit
MKPIWRISLSLLCAICGFVIAFVVGFYLSFLFGANIHDEMPGVFGLSFGLLCAVLMFNAMNKRLSK